MRVHVKNTPGAEWGGRGGVKKHFRTRLAARSVNKQLLSIYIILGPRHARARCGLARGTVSRVLENLSGHRAVCTRRVRT